MPLPGCLAALITEKVLPNARTETYAQEFKEKTLPQSDVQEALADVFPGCTLREAHGPKLKFELPRAETCRAASCAYAAHATW